MKKLVVVMMLLSANGCREPQMPRAQAPFSIHMFGAGETQLRGEVRPSGIVFSGRPTRDYGIGFSNESQADIGVSVLVDGLDASNGEPAKSCEDRCNWMVSAGEGIVSRGFNVDDTHVASYRFATPEQALATFTKGARRDAIGTIEACVFTTKPSPPRSPDETPHARSEFRGTVEREPSAVPDSVVSEIVPDRATRASSTCDRLLRRLVVRYEAEDGSPLGTAPPPAGIAKLAPPPPPRRVVESAADDSDVPVKTQKGVKPPKPDKGRKPPK